MPLGDLLERQPSAVDVPMGDPVAHLEKSQPGQMGVDRVEDPLTDALPDHLLPDLLVAVAEIEHTLATPGAEGLCLLVDDPGEILLEHLYHDVDGHQRGELAWGCVQWPDRLISEVEQQPGPADQEILEQFLLGAHVVIQDRWPDLGGLGQLSRGGAGEAAGGEECDRGSSDASRRVQARRVLPGAMTSAAAVGDLHPERMLAYRSVNRSILLGAAIVDIPPLIPRRVLFGDPERSMVVLSPNGERVAYLAPHRGVLNVWVREPSGDTRPVTEFTDRRVDAVHWAADSQRLICQRDALGDENYRLIAVDVNNGEQVSLSSQAGVQAQLIAVSPRHPNHALVGLNDRDPRCHDAYRVDLTTGVRELAARSPDVPPAPTWFADGDLRVRGAFRADLVHGGGEVLVRDTEHSGWRVLHSWGADDEIQSHVVGFKLDGSALYVISSAGVDRSRLLALDVVSGRETTLYEHPLFDVDGVVSSPESRVPHVARVWTDRLELAGLNPASADLVSRIQGTRVGIPDVVAIGSNGAALLQFVNDRGPQAFYLARANSDELELLFEDRPALAGHDLAAREPFMFTARDGLAINGYLTFPKRQERTGLPAVVTVHGGPWARDVWGWNAFAQLLADRGYLCVQVNFRGSTGYGKAFVNAAQREWGAKMHTDLLDAVGHLVTDGTVDASRVAILGGSYGGYAALVGAAFTPERFRCAVAAAGVSNLITLFESLPPYWESMKRVFYRRVGDPETEQEFLWSRSPLSRADNICIPLLLAHGVNDPRVKKSESDQLIAAVRARGIDAEYLVFEDEGHGFVNPENHLRFAAATESFLARHLGGDCEPSHDAQGAL